MKVILLAKVPGLGDVDDVKEASDGYARNYLFPKHLAVQASSQAIAELNAQKKRRAKEEAADLARQQSLAERVDGRDVTIKEKANEAGVLYAGVGPAQVASALKKLGFDIHKNQIDMKPIKETGESKAVIKFPHGLEAAVNIIVTA